MAMNKLNNARRARRKFTVIGVYDSTGEVIADWQRAIDAHSAMRRTAEQRNTNGDLTIIGAIAGHKAITAPCEDSGKEAAALDLTQYDICECGRPWDECAVRDSADEHGDR